MTQTSKSRTVMVVGGYGAFGSRAAERLLRVPSVDLIIAGRHLGRAQAAASALATQATAIGDRKITATKIDTLSVTADDVQSTGCGIILNASGPYQHSPARLAEAAINAGCHYVDLADDRDFVTNISKLNDAAKARGVLVVSGASSVPAISAAVIDHVQSQFSALTSVVYGISPGNNFDPGVATVRSILSYVGKPFSTIIDAKSAIVHGWQDQHRQTIGNLGYRWFGSCDVPDLALFPVRYPSLRTIRFGAGVEVPLFQLGLWIVSWLARLGVLRHPGNLAETLLAMKQRMNFLGTDAGGMFMNLAGLDANGAPKKLSWSLIARAGHGPTIPSTPAVIVIRKLLDGALTTTGAVPCVGLMTLDEIQHELADLPIEFALA